MENGESPSIKNSNLPNINPLPPLPRPTLTAPCYLPSGHQRPNFTEETNMSASAARIEANRANARFSTGLRTAEGKQRSMADTQWRLNRCRSIERTILAAEPDHACIAPQAYLPNHVEAVPRTPGPAAQARRTG